MLVLSRKLNETIVINDTIRITVVGIKGDRIRLGIEAPRDVIVDRGEVHARKVNFVEVIVPSAGCDETVDLGGLPVILATAP
jgi:carbon storage regulator